MVKPTEVRPAATGDESSGVSNRTMAAAPGSGYPDAGGGIPPVQPPAFCYRHPMRETLIRCVRCNRPICSDCMRAASVGFQCPDDVKLGRATQRPPRTSAGAVQRGARPYVTAILVALNVAVYVITAVQSVYGFNQPSRSPLFERWQMLPAAVGTGGEYYRLLTATFLHANVLHIVMNMLALVIIGPYLERLLGWWRYLSVYLCGALGGSVAIYLFGARFSPVVGASGAIFGLFAAALVFVRDLDLDPQWLVATIVLNLVVTFSVPDVSRLGHVGGFVCGGLAALAVAGNPRNRRWLSAPVQLAGLSAVAVLLVVGVVGRTLTF